MSETFRAEIGKREIRRRAMNIARLSVKLDIGAQFPTDTPTKLCHMIGSVAQLVVDTIDDAPDTNLIHASELLSNMSLELRYVERSKLSQTPWSMIEATEEFLKSHAGQDAHFIVRPQWSQNYGLVSEFVKVYRARLEGLVWVAADKREAALAEVADSAIYCISFPRLERLNALLHANLGHELGHVIAQRWVDSEFETFWSSLEQEVLKEVRSETRKRFSGPDVDLFKYILERHVSGQTTQAMNIAQDCLKELMSDAVGVQLLGPAALSAAVEFSACLSLDDSPIDRNNYPPWRYRLRKAFAVCEDDLSTCADASGVPGRAGEAIRAYASWLLNVEGLTRDMSDWGTLEEEAITRVAYKRIEEQWSALRTKAMSFLCGGEKEPYRLSERLNCVGELVQRLLDDIPPNETGRWPDFKPASFEDILNAAWITKIWRISSGGGSKEVGDLDSLFRLVLKAVETSQVQQTFGKRLRIMEEV